MSNATFALALINLIWLSVNLWINHNWEKLIDKTVREYDSLVQQAIDVLQNEIERIERQ